MSGPGSRRMLGSVLVAVIACLGVAGCAPTASTSGSGSEAAVLVGRRCTVCHTMDRIDEAKLDESGWNSTIDRMRNNGAVVSEAEQKVIVDYLVGR